MVMSGAYAMLAAQSPRAMVFDGARILDGNGGPPIENARLIVQEAEAIGFSDAFIYRELDRPWSRD